MNATGRSIVVLGVAFVVHITALISFIPWALRFNDAVVLPAVFVVSSLVGSVLAGWTALLTDKRSCPQFHWILAATVTAAVVLAALGEKVASFPQEMQSVAGWALHLGLVLVTTVAVMRFRGPHRRIRVDAIASVIAVGLAVLTATAVPPANAWYSTYGTWNPSDRRVVAEGRQVVRQYMQALVEGRAEPPHLMSGDKAGSYSSESFKGVSTFECPTTRLIAPPPATEISVHCELYAASGEAPIPVLNIVARQTPSGWVVLGAE